eukprot:287074_1
MKLIRFMCHRKYVYQFNDTSDILYQWDRKYIYSNYWEQQIQNVNASSGSEKQEETDEDVDIDMSYSGCDTDLVKRNIQLQEEIDMSKIRIDDLEKLVNSKTKEISKLQKLDKLHWR